MPKRVLLIQSDMRTAQPLARFFKSQGDEVWQAWDLTQGLALLEQVRPELLFLDLHFESGDWPGLLRQALEDVPRLRAMGVESFRIVKEEINLDVMVSAFLDALQVVCGP